MAKAPVTPSFDKSKYTGESGPSFLRFWDTLQGFFKSTSDALRRGLTLEENLAAGWVELELPASPSYPIPIPNPLPNGVPARGAQVMWVEDQATPSRTCTGPTEVADSSGDVVTVPAGGLFVEVGNAENGLVVRNVTGLPTGRAYLIRLAVFAG